MNKTGRASLCAGFAVALAAWYVPSASAAPVTLIETGGTFAAENLARGGTAFAGGELGYGIHFIHHLNDATYGNSNSWIGADGTAPIAGISLGDAKTVSSIAWGRDNTGQYSDRSLGTYQIQYTTAVNPDASTPDSSWTTIGTVTYDGSTPSVGLRHQYGFNAVTATGIRLVVPGSGMANGTCIDELELYSQWGLNLVETGGTMGWGNIADEGTAFAKDCISGYSIHQIDHLNDGLYGNDHSWIAGSDPSFAGIDFGGGFIIGGIAWGRDTTGQYGDRSLGSYTVQITTATSPMTAGDDEWTTIGVVDYDSSMAGPGSRHWYQFGQVYATGLRVLVDSATGDPICIDELEVYNIPEPATLSLLALAGMGLAIRRGRSR